MKLGIIDIGSTSVRMMVSDGSEEINDKAVDTTKLADGLAVSGALCEDAIKRTAAAVARFGKEALRLGADRVYAFATEAVRSATNGRSFLEEVDKISDVKTEVLSREAEAELGFSGAYDGGCECIVDMGGASTEITVGDGGGIKYGHSLPLGIVRLRDYAGPLTLGEYIDSRITEYGRIPRFDKLLAIGGTAGTMVSVIREAEVYNQREVHGTELTLNQIRALYKKLEPLDYERKKALKGLCPKRADVITGGVLMWIKILEYTGADRLTVSERDNMEGYLALKLREARSD